MTLTEAAAVAAVLADADDGCVFCAASLACQMRASFPEFDWVALVAAAGGWTVAEMKEAVGCSR